MVDESKTPRFRRTLEQRANCSIHTVQLALESKSTFDFSG